MKAKIEIPKGWRRLRTGTNGTRKGDRRLKPFLLTWEELDEDDPDTVGYDEIIIRRRPKRGRKK